MLFHSPQKKLTGDIRLKIVMQDIQKIKYVKLLGILMDEHLSWKHHTAELCKKLSRTSGIFFKSTALLSTPYAYLSLKVPVSSLLNYGIAAKGLAFESYLNPLFRLQKEFFDVSNLSHLQPPPHQYFSC